MENSHIEWTDHTFNPWEGCTKVSPGCLNCYAETRNARWNKGEAVNWGKGAPRKRTSAAYWKGPVKWDREGGFTRPYLNTAGEAVVTLALRRPRVFCASLADWLDEEVPVDWLADLLELIKATPNLDWLLLTKRPGNFQKRLMEVKHFWQCKGQPSKTLWLFRWMDGEWIPDNIWIGTTVEDQTRADERIPQLLRIPAKVRFLSCEPLLGPVTMPSECHCGKPGCFDTMHPERGLHWVICGGESGPGARPMPPEWARGLRDQCAAAGMPFFFKQWGEWVPCDEMPEKTTGWRRIDGQGMERVGKAAAGRLLDGVLHGAFPAVD